MAHFLDPIGTMCRLTALNFKPKNTKIGITNHIIEIQPPTTGQWIHRYMNDDTRDNISFLYNVVTKLIEWYLIPLNDIKNKKKQSLNGTKVYQIPTRKDETEVRDFREVREIREPKETKEVKEVKEKEKDKVKFLQVNENDAVEFNATMIKLCKYMCQGLVKLQETYELGNVVYTVQYYINLINDTLEGRFSVDRLPKCASGKTFEFNKIKNIWNGKKILDVCDLYDKCFEAQSDKSVPEEVTSNKIEGYLKAVDHLLSITDEEFREAIKV